MYIKVRILVKNVLIYVHILLILAYGPTWKDYMTTLIVWLACFIESLHHNEYAHIHYGAKIQHKKFLLCTVLLNVPSDKHILSF